MLLELVEDALDLDVNVITRKIEKEKLCELNYTIEPGGLSIEPTKQLVNTKNGQKEVTLHYLFSKFGVYFGEDLFTTSSKVKLYHNSTSIPINNNPLMVECAGEEEQIGYINILSYLHLPDYIMAQVLKGGGKVNAVRSKQVIEFKDGKAIVYNHSLSIPSPYYYFENKFTYYENADVLAEIIGAFDVYKRRLIKNGTITNEEKAIKYFLYPFVSMVLYKSTRTTLYPALIDPIITEVIDNVKDKVLEKLKNYLDNPLKAIENRIENFNKREQSILKVFK